MNNPRIRQQWILDLLKDKPNLSYSDVLGKYGVKWGKSENTFTKDWKKASGQFKEYQKLINEKVVKETTKTEIKTRKHAVLTKVEALAILSDIAKRKVVRVEDQLIMPSERERISAINELAKLEGWYEPEKTETMHSFKDFNIKDVVNFKDDNAKR